MSSAGTASHRKHIAPPATAFEISRGLGVTKKDAIVVDKVLERLGYLKAEEGLTRPVRNSARPYKRKATRRAASGRAMTPTS
jgi:hypothetical protein